MSCWEKRNELPVSSEDDPTCRMALIPNQNVLLLTVKYSWWIALQATTTERIQWYYICRSQRQIKRHLVYQHTCYTQMSLGTPQHYSSLPG